MAKKNKKTKRQVQYKSIEKNTETTPGIQESGGVIEASQFDILDDHTLMQDVTDMRNGDAIPSTTLEVVKLPIKSSPKRIEPGVVREGEVDKTEEAATYIDDQFDNLYDGFDDFKNHCLLSLDYGHILFEKIKQNNVEYITADNRKVKTNIITRMSPISYDGIEAYHYNDIMDFAGITHNKFTPDNVTDEIPVDADKLFTYTHNMEFRDVRGRSELRPARLAYNLKKKILIAGARGIQRGVFPLIGINGAQYEDDAHTIGRTAGNSEYSYVVYDKNNVEVTMGEVKNQGNLMEMLQYLDRQMFFNTLSQFMTSGLGENGSRAATSELKTSYELKANSILQEFENHVQRLVNEMMQMSYLAAIPKHQWPTFKLGAITQADLSAVATNLKALVESGMVVATPELQAYVNEMFSLPEAEVKQDIEDEEESLQLSTITASLEESYIDAKRQSENEKLWGKTNLTEIGRIAALEGNKCNHRELTEFEKEVFEFDNAVNTFKTTQEKAEAIITDDLNQFIDDITEQLQSDPKRNIKFSFINKKVDSTSNKLAEVYTEAFNQGNNDIIKEFNKVSKKKTELALGFSAEVTVKKGLKNSVKGLYEKVALNIESQLDRVTTQFIEKKGGLKNVLTEYKDFYKQDKRNIIVETQSGYTDGRGSQLVANKSRIKTYYYTTALDDNVCPVCEPVDGEELTFKEVESRGFSFGQPVNPGCAGKTRCRCQLIPLEVDDGPEIEDRILDPKIRIG